MGIIVNVPQGGLDYVLYGDKSSVVGNYVQNQLQKIPQVFNEFTQRVYDNLMTSYQWVNDQMTKYNIFNKLRGEGVNIVDNYFMELLSFQALQNANPTMQRWVMSHPDIRSEYLKGNVEGYPESYVNVFGEEVGSQDYNYRRVMDGVIQDTDDGFKVEYYIDELLPGDRELNHNEKVTVLNTWDAMSWIYENCKFDFTVQGKKKIGNL